MDELITSTPPHLSPVVVIGGSGFDFPLERGTIILLPPVLPVDLPDLGQ